LFPYTTLFRSRPLSILWNQKRKENRLFVQKRRRLDSVALCRITSWRRFVFIECRARTEAIPPIGRSPQFRFAGLRRRTGRNDQSSFGGNGCNLFAASKTGGEFVP